MDSETKRSSFTGKIGFILAAAGSAVGLGNIWRFPYLAAKYGGGIFLLVYIILSITFGFALMVAEIAIGRKTQQSPLGAFRALDKRFSWVGILATIIPVLILPYYSVIGGWVTKYMFGFMAGSMGDMANDAYFGDYIGKVGEPIVWFVAFIAITTLIVIFGVQKGIEKVSKVMMPMLVVLMLFIVIYSFCTLDGAWAGVVYYLKPDFSHFSIMTVVAAMGQLFYSMSLAMGIMITFGSYMKKDISIEKSTHQIEIFDTGIAFLSGLMIVPAVFAFSGGNESALGKGPGLMFITLPKIFNTMPGGAVIGAIFFMMVLLAALTSAISLMETVVAVVMDKLKLKRWSACLLVFGACLLLGLPSALGFSAWANVKILGMQFLDLFDFISNSILMPIVALATCIFVGFILKPKPLVEEAELSGKFKAKKLFEIMIKWIAPVCILAILISSVLDVFGIVKI
ncbi:MAG: sodium-dependent transporter [Ruminococcaceae bacterium]|nr:sodium-dependent transporter [Oscillospiraceae bacterium]